MNQNRIVSELTRQLEVLHQSLTALQPDITRIAVALYDPEDHILRSYAFSCLDNNPLRHYSVTLKEVESLQHIATSGQPRLIDDMTELGNSEHSQILLQAGMRSSYTYPIIHRGQLFGFVFFNSKNKQAFTRFVLPHLETTAYAIALLVVNEQTLLRTLEATLKSAIEVTHERNPETGKHLKRMSGYTRLIAQELAQPLELAEEFVEHLILFSSLHDIGKISIPDSILLKPDRLTPEEFETMKAHTSKGLTLIDTLLGNHALDSLDHIDMLRHIVELHHENWDGSGYPNGIRGDAIPIEAQIISVCDVFDALTAERPYKDRMSSEEAFDIIAKMAGIKLSPVCVQAMLNQRPAMEKIRRQYEAEE